MSDRVGTTWFRSLREPVGTRVLVSWSALAESLGRPRLSPTKDGAPGFSIATYQGDRRALVNVERVSAVGLDLDTGVRWDELTDLFAASSAIIHTTWSATMFEHRARVFLRLSRPVSGAEYRRVYAAVVARVEAGGLTVDRAASDPSRFWFVPSIREGGAYFRHAVCDGPPVDVDGALDASPAPTAPVAPARTNAALVAPDVEARAAAYLERCDPAVSGSGGSTVTLRLATKLVVGFGLDDGAAYRVMTVWNARCSPPWSERDLRRKIDQAREHGGRVMSDGALRDARRGRP